MGDFNTDLSRIHSTQTTALQQFCCGNHFVSKHVCSNSANCTFTSSINNSRLTIDHFIILDSLSEDIKNHNTIDDVDNMSDHNPLYLQLSLPITIKHIEDTRQFAPKPKWHAVSLTRLETYKHRLNELLLLNDIPTHVHLCTDIRCTEHKNGIDQFHADIIKCLLINNKDSIPFTLPYTFQSETHLGWNDYVKPSHSEALDWHSIWLKNGKPDSGFVHDIHCATRKINHKPVKLRDNHEKQIRSENIAKSFLQSDSRDFWSEMS